MKKWTNEEILKLREVYPLYGIKKTAEILGRSENSVHVKATRLKCQRPTHQFNKEFFDVIDTPDKAYWLGFITADGYIINNPKRRNYELGIELSLCDKAHLEKFKKTIDSDADITIRSKKSFKHKGIDKTYEECNIRLYSKHLVEALESYGIIQDKTNKMTYIDFPTKYMWDYIRGYYDGDGSISIASVVKNDGRRYEYPKISFVCKQKWFLVQLQRFLNDYNISANIYKDRDNWSMFIRKSDSVKNFFNKIYTNDCTCLQRKYDKYLLLLHN